MIHLYVTLLKFSEEEKEAAASEGDKIKTEKVESTEEKKKLDNGADNSTASGS